MLVAMVDAKTISYKLKNKLLAVISDSYPFIFNTSLDSETVTNHNTDTSSYSQRGGSLANNGNRKFRKSCVTSS